MAPWFPAAFDVSSWTSRRPTAHVDLVIATLANAQHGVVSVAQLRKLAVSYRQIEERVRSGHLHRLMRGVHAVGCPAVTAEGRRMGCVLASGPGARLAGWSGAVQQRILPDAGARVEIAIPPTRRVRLADVAITRARSMPSEVTVAGGIPCHTDARILLDLASRKEDPEVLEWAWRQAIFHQVLDLPAVQVVLGDHDGEPGTPALRALCDRRAELVGTVRNRFELRMLSIIREAGLPEPLCNTPLVVAPGVVLTPDFRLPQLALVIEADGRDGHRDVEFQLTDAQRDRYYRALGNTVRRYGWFQARRERGRVIADLQACAAAVGHRRR